MADERTPLGLSDGPTQSRTPRDPEDDSEGRARDLT